ncbi:zinc metallopeptidase [Paenalcaligenes niemegkensis]|uniref:KPN_02809 family neutral zinc metallopeptidase n=1 Tax=Paenalcaligenes niemegkensis TaxID=2895469 RepID=UPI001EE83319|nr:neutral zinc metallopeptidase [Paenalcaligenes niemegkensis]MCQ9615748.1 zinc metallopeptidase [Paenalcaligenes niemegkensis]
MRIDRSRSSRNIEDRRTSGRRVGKGSIGIGTIVLALVAMYFGVDPSTILQIAEQPVTSQQVDAPTGTPSDPQGQFVAKVLGETEDVWRTVFTQQTNGQYQPPTLVLFRDATPTACGTGQAAMGPFYCPADQKVYLDLGFFDELANQLNAPGDFARAYVIAHEIGHHVQNQVGSMRRAEALRLQGANANQVSVRVELQADCYAGIWAHHADRERQILEAGDIEDALRAASAVGDDTLQKRSRGVAVPDSFTHGSSAERMQWFNRGFNSGALQSCDTFNAS